MGQSVNSNLVQFAGKYGQICENMDSIPEGMYDEFGVKKGTP